jgi:serine/threonine protein kinase
LGSVIKLHIENLTRIPRLKIKKWIIEILEGIDFMHKNRVVHFDIKPENLFLDELERVKVGDLGQARSIDSITPSLKGTIYYVSPEMVRREQKVNEKTDIW